MRLLSDMRGSAASYGVMAWLSVMVIAAYAAGFAAERLALYATALLIVGLPALLAMDLLIAGIRAAANRIRAARDDEASQ